MIVPKSCVLAEIYATITLEAFYLRTRYFLFTGTTFQAELFLIWHF